MRTHLSHRPVPIGWFLLAWLIAAASVAITLGASPSTGATFGPAPDDPDDPGAPAPTAPARLTPTLVAPRDPTTVRIRGADFAGWALLDRRTGDIVGSDNADSGRSSSESMIKPWIAADYLRRLAERREEPTKAALAELNLMIVDSNDGLTEKYYVTGGGDAVIRRLITTCGLKSVAIESYRWALTGLTSQDAVRYGACLADGRAAGPKWTQWILDAMRRVRGGVEAQRSAAVQGGRWGIIDGLPPELAKQTAIKNGWTLRDGRWHINCLAVHDEWVLNVMMRRPGSLADAATGCADVAEQLVTPKPG